MDSENGFRPTLPIFLNVDGQRSVVVGGGAVALRKVRELIEAGAHVTVVAAEPSPDIERLFNDGEISLEARPYRDGDIGGAFIVFAATDDTAVNRAVYEAAVRNGILVNVVDNPGLCTFYSGAVVSRGPLRIAISTSGCCPAVAAALRRELEETYHESYGDFIQAAGEWRRRIVSMDGINMELKRKALAHLTEKSTFERFRTSGKESLWEELEKILSSS